MTCTAMSLPITAIFTGIFAILMVPLSLQISIHYARTGKTQADPNVLSDEVLRRKTRAHGNFIEYVPLALIGLGLVELGGASPTLVWSLGSLFLAARLIHVVGTMTADTPILRGIGMITGHAVYLTMGGWLIYANL